MGEITYRTKPKTDKMQKRTLFLFSLLILITIVSCKDDDDIQICIDCPENVSNFTQLAIGNYWIYENVTVDTNGVDGISYSNDSIYIAGDTLINGQTYFIQKKGLFMGSGFALLRDSSDFLVNKKGDILFSTSIFDSVLRTIEGPNNFFSIEYQMANKNFVVDVPAGSFPTYDFQGLIHFNDGFSTPVTDRILHNYYAKDVGLVKTTFFFSSTSSTIEQRLLRYHIE